MIRPREVLASGERVLRNETTRIRVWRDGGNLLVWTIEGHGTSELVKRLVVELDELTPRDGEFEVFNDTERMPSYDRDFRQLLTDWSATKRERLRAIHILTRSRVVAMGASVANLVLGGNVKMYSDRQAFESAFAGAGGTLTRLRAAA